MDKETWQSYSCGGGWSKQQKCSSYLVFESWVKRQSCARGLFLDRDQVKRREPKLQAGKETQHLVSRRALISTSIIYRSLIQSWCC